MSSSVSRVLVSLAVAAALVSGVSACASETEATPSETSVPPTSKPTETPKPTATQPPVTVGTPVTIDCNTLISPQAMYDFNPNFGLSDGFKPEAGSEAATIVAAKGLACQWVNQTSGEVIQVAVADLPADKLTALKNSYVTSSNSVPTYGVEGYFEMDDSFGVAEAFSGSYWISARSNFFLEPGDAQPIIAAAIAGLG